jgi:biotin carboxyl carrier protein
MKPETVPSEPLELNKSPSESLQSEASSRGDIANAISQQSVSHAAAVPPSVALGWVEALSKAVDQKAATVALVNGIAEQCPGGRVRCGIGDRRLKRLYDLRLGWLSPTSEVFIQAESCWNEPESQGGNGKLSLTGDQKAATANDQTDFRLNIDAPNGVGRCVLWVEERSLHPATRDLLRTCRPTFQALLWQRSLGLLSHLTQTLSKSGMTARFYLGAASLILLLLCIWPVSYRVRCSSVVRPMYSRVVSAPFEAVLKSTLVEPGDHVRAGETLLTLDGRPLRLELEEINAKIAQVEKERDIAMVAGKVAESQQASLRIRELSRRRDLIENRLSQLQVTSPIDGVVVSGELERSIGASVEMGQSMIEVAPLDQMVIELEIPEYEIGFVDAGAEAKVRFSSNSTKPIERPIELIFPSAEIRDDQNVFIARMNVENSKAELRPGMHGDAIAYGPMRPWMWSLVRKGWENALWWIGY